VSSVLTVVRAPLSLAPVRVRRQSPGLSLADMARALDMPSEWWAQGIIAVDGHVVPRALWERTHVRPRVREVRFLVRLAGGGDGAEGSKNPFALIGSLALLSATGFVGGGGLAPLLGSGFAAGTIGARVAAGLIGAAGAAALNRAARPSGGGAGADLDAVRANTASLAGNVLQPDGTIPRVLGTRKVFPPLVCQPLVYFDGDDQIVEGVMALSGEHEMSDIRFGNADIADIAGLEIETRPGTPGQTPLSLVTRQSRTDEFNSELVPHKLRDDGITVDDSLGTDWRPQPSVMTTRFKPDEFWIAIAFAQGLSISAQTDAPQRVPIRLRLRRLGTSDWVDLPELHFVGAALRPIQATIRLQWEHTPSVQVDAPAQTGFVEARIASPGQTAAPVSAAFAAHSSFVGSGDDYLVSTNIASTAVRNVHLTERVATITLDRAAFVPDLYEVQILRGAAVSNSAYASASYQVSGSVWDLFGARGGGTLAVVTEQKNRVSTLALVRASSIWRQAPVQTDECALIAVRARNQALGRVSVVAAGVVPVREGSSWAGRGATDNPAGHFRDVLTGRLNARALEHSMIDDDELVAWWTDCAAKDYRVNAVIDGGTVRDALERIAAVGFARPRRSQDYGVVRARDTSAEPVDFVFTERNSRGFSMVKAMPDPPVGFRATFADRSRDYLERQIIWPPNAHGELEARRYTDVVDEADVIRAMRFELAEQAARTAAFVLTAPAEAIPMRRGNLVGVVRDLLEDGAASARVDGYTETGGGALVSLRLDGTVPVLNEPALRAIANLRAVPDIRALGKISHVAIRGSDAAAPVLTYHALSNSTGDSDTLTLAVPVADTGIAIGDMVAIGPRAPVLRRMVVSDIRRADEFTAEVTLVAEAPELTSDH